MCVYVTMFCRFYRVRQGLLGMRYIAVFKIGYTVYLLNTFFWMFMIQCFKHFWYFFLIWSIFVNLYRVYRIPRPSPPRPSPILRTRLNLKKFPYHGQLADATSIWAEVLPHAGQVHLIIYDGYGTARAGRYIAGFRDRPCKFQCKLQCRTSWGLFCMSHFIRVEFHLRQIQLKQWIMRQVISLCIVWGRDWNAMYKPGSRELPRISN